MRFRPIKKIVLFGGSRLLAEFAICLSRRKELELVVFIAPRHLSESVTDDKLSLRAVLKKNKIRYFNSRDINKDSHLRKEVTKNTLGISVGAAWIFDQKTVNLFSQNHLLDFMGIDLPRYRGGAHYTWQILHQTRRGCSNLQIIQGGPDTFHKGPIIKRKEYKLPPTLHKPIDFFNFIVKNESAFLKEFLLELKRRTNFSLKKLDEYRSSYYPFLSTAKHGLINWGWSGRDIYLFINAFDNPYSGASTYLNGHRVFLKNSHLLPLQEKYHPFTSGVVVRKNKDGIFIASSGNLLNVRTVLNEKGRNIINEIGLGDRFFTPSSILDRAMEFGALYTSRGLK